MYDVVCIGSATQDVFVKTNLAKVLELREMLQTKAYLCLDYGAKINVDKIMFTTGGGASNTAFGFGKMGLRTGFCSALGNDESARIILNELAREGVDTSLAFRVDDETGYSVIITTFEGERTVLTYRGANNLLDFDRMDMEKITDTKFLYLGPMTGRASDIPAKFAAILADRDVKICWNPGNTQISRGIDKMLPFISRIDILFLNKEEASNFTGIKYSQMVVDEDRCIGCGTCVDVCPVKIFALEGGKAVTRHQEKCTKCGLCVERCPARAIINEPWADNLDPILKKIHGMGVKLVVITDGKKGVQCYDGRYRYMFPAYDVPVVSTLGAGDAFTVGFIAALAKGKDIETALRVGSANGASVVQQFGAKCGLLTWEEAMKFIGERGVAVRRSEI
ncbi:MAG: PfkB family carbohydrate kinase [Thermoplasmata archaeon]|nr:PfkB family carbohydrate kinase [Thermoplasmata archaeon]